MLDRGLYRTLTSRPSIRYFLGKAFEGSAPDEMIDYAYATAHQPGARHAPFCFLSMGLFSPDACSDLYRPLPVPGLVIYDRDPNVTFTRLPALLESAPQWRAQRIAPTLGLPHWEQTEATCAALESFWQDIGRQRRNG